MRATRAERVLRPHRTMRLTMSPAEALEVDVLLGHAGRAQVADDEVGPRTRTADVDVALGHVGDPGGEGGEVAGSLDPVAQPRVGGPPGAGDAPGDEAAVPG